MGKKRKLSHQPASQPKRGPPPKAKPKGSPKDAKQHSKKNPPPPPSQPPTIPFCPTDHILLIGEGDLSFAASLITHHECINVTATVLEKSRAELLEKYPHAEANMAIIESSQASSGDDPDGASKPLNKTDGNRLLYNVDVAKMPAFVHKSSRKPLMDCIIFNFPHVGGKSTDVNRQVRYNQELLVNFFGKAEKSLQEGGTIVVTLFEGEPYTLWNVRDLGRHCGLAVQRSFRFQSGAYPGYRHARTLGVVRNKKGEEGGGWRGEERASRSYVFARKGEVEVAVKKKRKRDSGDDDEGGEEVPYDSD